jgi:hypothetical protein
LEGVLKYQAKTQNHEIDKLDATYLPVFDSLLVGQLHKAKEDLVKEFQMVIGTIVLLAEPLSVSSLASLLDIEEFVIERRLSTLHSVLDVPDSAETPVRICHLSLRDFLIDSNKRDTNPFWIDEDLTHEMIATRCLTLLSSHDNLKEDICDLKDPGSARADVPSSIVDEHLPSDVRYACLHWVYHTEQSKASINDTHQVYIFLKCHFLHWLEALSLLGKISESIHLIRSLQILVGVSLHKALSKILADTQLSYSPIQTPMSLHF